MRYLIKRNVKYLNPIFVSLSSLNTPNIYMPIYKKQVVKILNMVAFYLTLNLYTTQAQELKKHKLDREDVKKGVWAYYEYREKDSYGYVGLQLFKNGAYQYKVETAGYSSFSKGKWIMKNKVLLLTSDIKKNDLPVKLNYLIDSPVNASFKISIVKNLKDELLTDAFVYINNDSLQCLPLTETCLGTYDKIDRIKVVFENGMRSKWIKVEHKVYKQLQPVLQLDFNISSYEAIDSEKYKVLKSSIRLLN